MHTSVLLRHSFPSTFKPSDSSRVTSSPSLDLDQSCQAGEQAKFNSIGGVFLGSSSILHTSVLLGHSFPSTFKPSDSSRLTPLLLQFNVGVFLGSSEIVQDKCFL